MSEWQPIAGHEGYFVSDEGAVKGPRGLFKPWLNDQGYFYVRLSNPRRMARVHRLVAMAFLPNPEAHSVVNHIDNNRTNNRVSNLEWTSQWGNLEHAAQQGRMQRDYWKGRRSPNARLTDIQVAEIRDTYSRGGMSWKNLGRAYGVGKRSIGRIIRGESYV